MIEETTTTMNLRHIRFFAAALCINERIFRRSLEILKDKLFPEQWTMHRFVFDVLCEHWDEFGRLPSKVELKVRLTSDMSEYGADREDIREVNTIFELADDLRSLEELEVYEAASRYLIELVETILRRTVRDQILSGDISSVLRQTQETLLIAGASDDQRFAPSFGLALDNRKEGQFLSIGNEMIDLYCGGTGPASGDVIAHAAPRSGGKSTLAAQVIAESSTLERRIAAAEGRRPRFSYIFNYEKYEDPLTHTLSYGAQIPRDTIEEFIYTKSLTGFSSGRNYKPYEKKKWGSMIAGARQGKHAYPFAELERFHAAREMMDQNIFVADFSPSNQALSPLASNYVDGIADFISQHQLRVGNPGVLGVAVDYASECVDRYLEGRSSRDAEKEKNSLIQKLCMRLKHYVCVPYQGYGWVSQQLAADEASKARGSRPDPNKFKGCKAFAENADYAIVNGLPTLEGLAIFVHSKSRRGQPERDMVVRLDGKYSNWQSASNEHTVINGRIASVSDAQMLSNPSTRINIDRD